MLKVTLMLLASLPGARCGHPTVCRANIFGSHGDKWAGGPMACTGQRVKPTDVGFAHRTWPCGTKALVMSPSTGMMTVATVIDRGPYGATKNGQWEPQVRLREGWRRGSCVDLTPVVAARLGHRGPGKVILVPIRRKGVTNGRRAEDS